MIEKYEKKKKKKGFTVNKHLATVISLHRLL